tara:strand:+ start:1968 stop:2915 length:948 start_codon:yes stop_codon:yes gene_type:complete
LKVLRIGTRGSPLALWQAQAVTNEIIKLGGPPCKSVIIKTTGDREKNISLSEIGGKNLFVKEIEEALLSETIDLAVHSAKDLPTELPTGLIISSTLQRGDPTDALVMAKGKSMPSVDSISDQIFKLGSKIRIGTDSVRRIAQLKPVWPNATFLSVRGNIDTRIQKLDRGEYDILVLASAGLIRLGLTDRISSVLPIELCVPAPCQGIVAIETRKDDSKTNSVVEKICDHDSMASLKAERATLKALGGDCRVPIGALSLLSKTKLKLAAVVASLDGSRILRQELCGSVEKAEELGLTLASNLIRNGASEILTQNLS